MLLKRPSFFWGTLALLLIVADQLSKYVAVYYGWPIFYNSQFAFSLPVPTVLMYVLYALIEMGIIYYVIKSYFRLLERERFAWTLVIAGSMSNIAERIIYGHVRDFIPLLGGILNLADFFILIGVAILLFGNFYLRKS